MVRRKVRRKRDRLTALSLNDNHNHDLKNLFKGLPSRPALTLVLCTISMARFCRKACDRPWRVSPSHERWPPLTLTIWTRRAGTLDSHPTGV